MVHWQLTKKQIQHRNFALTFSICDWSLRPPGHFFADLQDSSGCWQRFKGSLHRQSTTASSERPSPGPAFWLQIIMTWLATIIIEWFNNTVLFSDPTLPSKYLWSCLWHSVLFSCFSCTRKCRSELEQVHGLGAINNVCRELLILFGCWGRGRCTRLDLHQTT